MKRILPWFCPTLALLVSLPAWGQSQYVNGNLVADNQVLIKFRDPAAASLERLRGVTEADEMRPMGGSGVYLLKSHTKAAPDMLGALRGSSDLLYAEPNYIVTAVAVPNDPLYPQLYGMQRISAEPAWDITTGSTANVVGVVDTGVDYNHEDLADNIWSAPAEFTVVIEGVSITCPAGSHGFNAINQTCDPMDDFFHGTHVSGTIGAIGNNGLGVAGVNWTASIMGLKFLNSQGVGTVSGAIDAIDFAIQAKQAFADSGAANLRVLSNSWGGGGFDQALLDEINLAGDHDMLFVVAAGNNGQNNDLVPFYPASYDAANLVAVAATDSNDNKAGFSNYGPASVHLGAPGVNVVSTLIGNRYGSASGTSMATPQVSGAAALVLSVCDMDIFTLKDLLLASVDPLDSLAGLTITGGRLNVYTAIAACTGGQADPASRTARH